MTTLVRLLIAIPLLTSLSLSLACSLHMECDCFGAMLRLCWWRHLGWPGWLHIGPAMTTNNDTSIRKLHLFQKKKNNPATLFLKVRYTCKLFLGKEGSICGKKKRNYFDPKGMEVLSVRFHENRSNNLNISNFALILKLVRLFANNQAW